MSDWQRRDVTAVWVVCERVCERELMGSYVKGKRGEIQSAVPLHAIMLRLFSFLPENPADFRASLLFPFSSITSPSCHTVCLCKQVFLVGHVSVVTLALPASSSLIAVRRHTSEATQLMQWRARTVKSLEGRWQGERTLSVHSFHIIRALSFTWPQLQHQTHFKSWTWEIICKKKINQSFSFQLDWEIRGSIYPGTQCFRSPCRSV